VTRYLFREGRTSEWYTITPDVKGEFWYVQRDGGERYEVVPTHGKPSCSCAWFIWKCDGLLAVACRHVRAVRQFLKDTNDL
jgi:hypothetical protein